MEKRKGWLLVSAAMGAGALYLVTLEGALAKGSAIWVLGFGLAALRKARPPSIGSAGYSTRNHWMVVVVFAGLSVGLAAVFLAEPRPIRYLWLFGSLCALSVVGGFTWVGLKMRHRSEVDVRVPSD